MTNNKVPCKQQLRRAELRQTAVVLAYRTDRPTQRSTRWLTYATIA